MNSYTRFLDALRDTGCAVDDHGDRADAQSPGHSPADRSLSVYYNRLEGRTAFWPHSARDTQEGVLDDLRLTWRDLYDNPEGARYEYSDGRKVFRSPDKKFHQSGNTHGDQLFRANRLGDADKVYIAEGEHDVLTLEQEGAVATCTAMGAGKADKFDLTPLYGKQVIVVMDRDEAGARHAAQIIDLLAAHAEVSVVQARTGKDAADHVVSGNSLDDFLPVEWAPKRIAIAKLTHAVERMKTMDLEPGLDLVRTTVAESGPKADVGDLHSVYDVLMETWTDIQRPEAERESKVIPTPWANLNRKLAGGLHAGRSYIIAARPGLGKSIWVSTFALSAARQGFCGLVYSLEMPRTELGSRFIADGSTADYGQVVRKRLDNDNLARVSEFLGGVDPRTPLTISDRSSMTLSKIAAEARSFKAERGRLDFIAIDYLQLLKHPERDRQKALTEISREVKILAGELECAIIEVCQLNRGSDKDKRKPVISDLRESGALEQDCDVCILLHHPTNEDGSGTGDVVLIIGKNRTGPLGEVTQPWQGHYARIGEYER